MKRITLAFMTVLMALAVHSQQVPRELVIMEKGTGTWCVYCPGAAMGADDLIANGCSVAVIAYHYNDSFTNAAGLSRIGYYGISAYPTAEFDGVIEHVGGSSSSSLYGTYLPMYQQRIAIPSDFTVEMYGDNTGLTYDITLVMERVATSSASNIKAHLVLTESEIPFSWFIMSEVNYVERLMVPNASGTSVDFNANNPITLNLQFTIDASWNVNHLELVAFLQDDNTKECLQGTKVMLNDLQPFAATANFMCDDQTPCVTSSVQFTDLSGGDITSWNWSFEGGNPSSSTDPNPQVTYSALGEYDVQLVVSDGVTIDTMLNTDYITVITAPAQPNTPTGNTVLCEGGSQEVYETDPVAWGATYVWMVDPPAAGTITGIDPVATFTPNPSYVGTFDIKVRCDNSCGQGTWSQPLNAEIHITPEDFTLSQGGGYCEGEPGIELTLDGSEAGVDYELYLDGDPTGTVVPGTGSSISFGYQTEQGIYTCHAFTAYCGNDMIGNSYIFVTYSPGTAATPTGSTAECNNHLGVEYTTTGAQHADTYIWSLLPASAGTITGDDETATVDWTAGFTGSAYISVQGTNECGTGQVSDELAVTVSQAPEPVVDGEAMVCAGDEGILYFTDDHAGNSYDWEVTGGTVTAGAGTHEIAVDWGPAGTGYVTVTETSSDNCEGVSETFVVTIEDCTGLGEKEKNAFNIYPNPVKDELVLEFSSKDIDAKEVFILNQYGQVVYSGDLSNTSSGMKISISTSGLTAGIYSIRVRTDEGNMIEKKFVKVK